MDVVLSILTLFAGGAAGWAFLQLFKPPPPRWKWLIFAVAVLLGVIVSFLTSYALIDLGLMSPDADPLDTGS